jgi:hypothetical protein
MLAARLVFVKARGRSPGEILGQVIAGVPWKGETQGSSQWSAS